MISNEVVRALKDHVEFVPICPEIEIGLTVPRDPLQAIVSGKKKLLLQIKDKRDFSALIKVFAAKFLETHKDLDGFILKSKSPSCGAYSTKIYKTAESTEPVAMGSGLFAEIVQKIFPLIPVIEESDLNDEDLLDYFLTRVYTLAAFRVVEQALSIESLRQFQEKNEILFAWLNPALFSSMNALLKQCADIDPSFLLSNYRNSLLLLLQQRPPAEETITNLAVAISGFIHSTPQIDSHEVQDLLTKYSQGKVPLWTLRRALKAWAERMHYEKLMTQTFCAPYPEVGGRSA